LSVGVKAPITDSAWFWVVLFSCVGLLALFVMHGHYSQRQARIERQYQARDRVANNDVGDPTRREYSRPDDTLITLWPLATLLVGVAVVASAMLYRERRRHDLVEGPAP
jgi:hypothetical protein